MSKIRRKLSLILGLAAASFAGLAMAAKGSPSLMSDADLDKINGAGGGTIGGRPDSNDQRRPSEKKHR
ncbi:hypothetical protein [Limnohabitans sp. Jir72]|uniref:hypothetical protein n=1 Tax=Limnohabitans sp. Jir72 TaxID=1977909 RepID=UPI0011B24973|nr:hypothetical protein [Limnohabitans sp. Jir72]